MGDTKADAQKAPAPPQASPAQAPFNPLTMPIPSAILTEQMGNAAVARMLGSQKAGDSSSGSSDPTADVFAVAAGLLGGALSNQILLSAGFTERFDVELKGHPTFDPSYALGGWIKFHGNPRLRARFGDLAMGDIYIRHDDDGYQARPTWLPMNHPDLVPRTADEQLGIVVEIVNSEIRGKIGLLRYPPAQLTGNVKIYPSQQGLMPILFGRAYEDPYSVKLFNWENALRGGELRLGAGFRLTPPDGPEVTGAFQLIDEGFGFAADVVVAGAGLQTDFLKVERQPSGLLTSRKPLEFSQDWKAHGFSGQVAASFVDGTFDARARVAFGFPTSGKKRLTGEVNVVLTSLDRAWDIARSHSPSPDILPGLEPGGRGSGIALTGWGTLTLEITKGFSANAAFVVDPDGYLTVRGKLRTPREIKLVEYEWGPKQLIDPPPSWELAGVPLFLGVKGAVVVDVWLATGALVKATLRNIVVEGLYSTRPGVGSQLEIGAALNASANAWIEAGAKFSGTVMLGGFTIDLGFWEKRIELRLVTIGLGLKGRGSLGAYAEISARLKREGGGDPAVDEAQYRVAGRLEAGGAVDVSLSATGGIDLLGIVSPSFSHGVTNYELAGGAIAVDFDHVLGSGDTPSVKVTKPRFDPAKFVRDIRGGHTPRDTTRPVTGTYRDRTTGASAATSTTPPAALPPVPKAGYELKVPFEIDDKPHQLFLVLKTPPIVEVASGKRQRLSERLFQAGQRVEWTESWEVDPGRLRLLAQQRKDLAVLIESALGLETDAARLGEDPTDLFAGELPGLEVLATALAEYGERYQDAELAGVAILSNRRLQRTTVSAETAVIPGTDTSIKGSPEAMRAWVATLQTRPTPGNNDRYLYQQRVAGTTEYLATSGNETVWADGVRIDRTSFLDSKFVNNPDRSPYIPGSGAPDFIRQNAQDQVDDEFRRYALVIEDETRPVTELRVITNEARARQYFVDALSRNGVTGGVDVVP